MVNTLGLESMLAQRTSMQLQLKWRFRTVIKAARGNATWNQEKRLSGAEAAIFRLQEWWYDDLSCDGKRCADESALRGFFGYLKLAG
jgi:hypothetical protein